MKKLSVSDVNYNGKRVLVRCDFNVPLDDNQNVADDSRIVAALPTIKKLIDDGARVILCSHLGRPKGEKDPKMSLNPVAGKLSEHLNKDVVFADDCIGDEAKSKADSLGDGDILLLENLRFHAGEKKNDPEFAKQLASLADTYVNDAFGTAHRAHASTEGVTKYFDQCAGGFLIEKEIKYLGDALAAPQKPFAAILGGAKVSGKIDVIENLMGKVDSILIGGGMVFTFLKAQKMEIGDSLLEEDRIDMAGDLLKKADEQGSNMILPVDIIAADEVSADAKSEVVSVDSIPKGKKGLDIGPDTIEKFRDILQNAKTVVWNGPMGVFEIDKFAKGTYEIAKILADITDKGAVTIVGGGDSASAVRKSGLEGKLSHISTGGGASLEFLEGKTLPGIAALTDA